MKALLLGYFVAALLAFLSTRFYFWFPDWILKSLVAPFFVESPRGLSFFVFQIPGYLIDLILPFSPQVFEIKKTLLNALLSFYPSVGITICVLLLSREQRRELMIFPLIAFGLLYPYSALPTFSGAQHAFFFFWILMCMPVSKAESKPKLWPELVYFILYLLFYFCYPPFSFLGSIVLGLRAFTGQRQIFRIVLAATGTVASGVHLLFLRQIFPDQTYFETFLGLEKTFGTYHFYFLILVCAGILFTISNRKFFYPLLFCICAAPVVWVLGEIFRPAELLTNQFHNRIYVYGISAFIAVCMLVAERFGTQRNSSALSWSLAFVVLLTGLFSDIRASANFWQQKQIIKSQINQQTICTTTTLDTYPENGVSPWEFPYYSIFNWSEFDGHFVICDPALAQKEYPVCNFRFLESAVSQTCGSPKMDFDTLLKKLRTQVALDKAL